MLNFPRKPSGWWLSAAIAVALAVVAWLWHLSLQHKLRALQAEQSAVAQALAARPGHPAPQPHKHSVVPTLPAQAHAEPLLRHLLRSSAAQGVALMNTAVLQVAPTLQTLGRQDMAVSLRGPYPRVKAVLADVAGAHGNLVWQRLVLRRAPGPGNEVDAQVELSLLSQPLAVAPMR